MTASATQSEFTSPADFLLRRINYERTTNFPYLSADFKLDRMRRLMSLLADPHLGIKAIHIAGTKGKGSTAVMIAEVLAAAGYRTGLYTSPHLDRIEERIKIDGQSCPPDEFLALAAEVQPAVEQLDREADSAGMIGPTFFEVTTAMAFLHFAQANVAAAVLEVGLGGRLDSTNVCQPAVCVITSISFDHMRQLGHTLAAIAGEKAGIIKPGVPMVSGVMADEPRQVIAARARDARSRLFQRGVDFDFQREVSHAAAAEALDYLEQGTELGGLRLGMPGKHQAANAACAIAAVLRLRERGWNISDGAIRAGLAAAQCPGRIELLGGRPAVVLDVAHNPASIAALIDVLEERLPGRRKVLIFASSKDKDYASMLRLLLPKCAAIVLTQYIHNPRAMEAEQLGEIAREIIATENLASELRTVETPVEGWMLAQRLAGADDLICITGSFFLAAELRPLVSPSTVEAIESSASTGVPRRPSP